MNTKRISIQKYLQLFRNTDRDMIQLLAYGLHGQTTDDDDAQRAVATTWIISFSQIYENDILAGRLLSFVAWIEPTAIAQMILPSAGSEQEMTSALGTICGFDFLKHRRGDGEVFDMHPLVHKVLQSWLIQEQAAQPAKKAALEHFKVAFPSDTWDNRELYQQYLPHVLCFLGHFDDTDDKTAQLRCRVGTCLLQESRASEAIQVIETVARQSDSTSNNDKNPIQLAAIAILGRAYNDTGRNETTINFLGPALDALSPIIPENNNNLLETQLELAKAYFAHGQIKNAIQLTEKVIRIRKNMLEGDGNRLLASYHLLAVTYRADGRSRDAIKLLRKIELSQEEEKLPENNQDRLACQHVLAAAYNSIGKGKKAIHILERVVSIQQKDLPNYHFHLLASQHELAASYRSVGRLEKALSMFEQVVAIRRETLSEKHPDLLKSQTELAVTYHNSKGRIEDAISLLKQVLRKQEQTLQKTHYDRLTTQHHLARSYLANNQNKAARLLIELVVSIRNETLPLGHPERLASLQVLAYAYAAEGQLYKAIKTLDDLMDIQDRINDPGRDDTREFFTGVLKQFIATHPQQTR